MPSFGGEVKVNVSHVPALRHVKDPTTSVNYDVLAKFLVYFPPSLAEVPRAYVVRGARVQSAYRLQCRKGPTRDLYCETNLVHQVG